MRIEVECVFVIVWCIFLQDSSEEGYCNFPAFLYAPLPDGSERKWLSKTEYVRNTNTWERQKEITVRATEMIIKHKVHASCSGQGGHTGVPCFRKDILYQVICVAEEPGEKYRVQQRGHEEVGSGRISSRESMFSCMKFVRVNKNIIQVYSAVPKELNEDRLCYEESLQREEWPWIVPVQEAWSLCPLVGGFDFVTYYSDMRQLCEKVWRPSRMESECIYGEGIDFFFPDTECNPFLDATLKTRLYCWGSWDEDDYKFVLIGAANSPAQYVMRFPTSVDMYAEFTAYLYFSPVCPLTGQGEPPGKLQFSELRMKRSEPGVCFDESEKCRDFAMQGKCTNSALHEYANYCKRSCGLCDFQVSPRPECSFPSEYLGEWMLFESDRKESVTIVNGEVTFSNVGHFICKTIHWAINRYKLLSIFSNGCRPRYTCMHVSEESDTVLQFQISRSKHTDESFHMCEFEDDPPPLSGKIRSKDMKILLPTSRIHWGSCGLTGEIRVNTTFSDGLSCNGILTDWNPKNCNARSKLSLAVDSCKGRPRQDQICIAHINVDDDYSLLITQTQGDERKYKCWAIQTYPESMFYRPWRRAYMMTGAQCGTETDLLPGSRRPHSLTVQAYTDRVQQPCRESNDRVLDDDYYDTETKPTPKSYHHPSTTRKPPPYSNHNNNIAAAKDSQTKHSTENESIKPRERKSNESVTVRGDGVLVCVCLSIVNAFVFEYLRR